MEFAIPGAPTDTIDVKIMEDSVHLTAPARDIEYVSALALGWPVKPDIAEATYEHALLRIEVPFKDPVVHDIDDVRDGQLQDGCTFDHTIRQYTRIHNNS